MGIGNIGETYSLDHFWPILMAAMKQMDPSLIVALRNTAQNERYVSGIFANEEKIVDE